VQNIVKRLTKSTFKNFAMPLTQNAYKHSMNITNDEVPSNKVLLKKGIAKRLTKSTFKNFAMPLTQSEYERQFSN
jgi:hypothetical protein